MIQSIPNAAGAATGGAVGGASNLTTVGAVPYVSSSGVLNQDASKLFWDTSGSYLYAGGYTSASVYSVRLGPAGSELSLRNGLTQLSNSGTVTTFNTTLAAGYVFNDTGFNAAISIKGNTGNIQLGGTTDGNYKLDIQKSGTTGTLRVYDQTATTGSTLAVIQAGAGQSGNLLSIRNNAGTEIAFIGNAGQLSGTNYYATGTGGYDIGSDAAIFYNPGTPKLLGALDFTLQWRSGVNYYSGTVDSGIARAAAGYVKVTDGSTGLGKIVVSQSTPAASTDAGTAGAIWADATYIYVQTAAGTVKRIALTTF